MRREVDITIAEAGRDQGKVFHLTEMPALQAEKWAMRALFALAQSGVEVSPDLLSGGMASIAVLGVQALLNTKFSDAEPLLDEMLDCVQIKEAVATRKLFPGDVEEVRTYLTLRREVLKLHVGFSSAGAQSK